MERGKRKGGEEGEREELAGYFIIDLPSVVVSEIWPVMSVNPGTQSTSLKVDTKMIYIVFKCLYVASFPGSPSLECKQMSLCSLVPRLPQSGMQT